MPRASAHPVVHLELHTGNLPRACAFFERLFEWRTEVIRTGSGSYTAIELSDRLDGGVVECDTEWPGWLPYVEVADVAEVTQRARLLGAAVALEPREGPAGWRAIVVAPAGGAIGLWQPKTTSLDADGVRR